MAWVDPQTGRRYTDKEVAGLEAPSEPSSPESPETSTPNLGVTDPAVAMGRSLSPENLKAAGSGFMNALKAPFVGIKQLGAYAFGDDAKREAVNQEAKDLEAEQEALGPAGTMGNFVGNAATFAVPGSIVGKAGKVLPDIVKTVQKVTGKPGSVGRSTLEGSAFEAAQPVNPSDLSTEQFLQDKALKLGTGAALSAPTSKVANITTRSMPPVSPERTALAREAERLGFKLTPAQRTGDPTLQQYEEGLLAKPGSGKLIAEERRKQQEVFNKKSAESIGSRASAPSETELSLARERANTGYEPIAAIPKLAPDVKYFDALTTFQKKQRVRPITGSKNTADLAERLKENSHRMTGQIFLEELQGMRDLAYKATKDGDKATATQLRDLGSIMEDFLERKVDTLSKMKGSTLPPDAVAQLKAARMERAKVHAIEGAVNPDTGAMSANKYLTQERRRRPASSGRGTSSLDVGLRDVGDTARVLRQVQPYIGSSGTAERQAGQQMVDMVTGPFQAIKGGIPLAKNYIAAKYYLAHGGEPGFLGKHLSPTQNMMVRRLLPEDVVSAEEANR